jgi:hypothetical protein
LWLEEEVVVNRSGHFRNNPFTRCRFFVRRFYKDRNCDMTGVIWKSDYADVVRGAADSPGLMRYLGSQREQSFQACFAGATAAHDIE